MDVVHIIAAIAFGAGVVRQIQTRDISPLTFYVAAMSFVIVFAALIS